MNAAIPDINRVDPGGSTQPPGFRQRMEGSGVSPE